MVVDRVLGGNEPEVVFVPSVRCGATADLFAGVVEAELWLVGAGVLSGTRVKGPASRFDGVGSRSLRQVWGWVEDLTDLYPGVLEGLVDSGCEVRLVGWVVALVRRGFGVESLGVCADSFFEDAVRLCCPATGWYVEDNGLMELL
jgi:hypothetical protein